MPDLTDRQKEIVAFIRGWWRDYRYGPSYQDIADGLTISKTSAIDHVRRLIRLGVVKRTPRVARSIRTNRPNGSLSGVGKGE